MRIFSINTDSKRIRITLLLVLILAAAAGVVFLAWPRYQTHTERIKVVNSYGYKYGALDAQRVEGIQPSTGMNFEKPKEFRSTLADSKAPIADLSHEFGKEKIRVADMVAYSQPSSNDTSQESLAKILSDPKNPKYAQVLLPIQQFAAQRLVNLDISYADAQTLATPNLKHAWKLGFTSSAKSKRGALPEKKGVIIITAGAKTNYYLLIDAINTNWDGNQAVWQKVIDSLRIDQ